jgi:hypothetical protein
MLGGGFRALSGSFESKTPKAFECCDERREPLAVEQTLRIPSQLRRQVGVEGSVPRAKRIQNLDACCDDVGIERFFGKVLDRLRLLVSPY